MLRMEVQSVKKLDAIDAKILRPSVGKRQNLQRRAGISGRASPPGPCWQRVRRLEAEGFITGYHARVDQSQLGAPEIVFVEVSLEHHNRDALRRFGENIQQVEEVLEAFMTSGDYDYLLKVAVFRHAWLRRISDQQPEPHSRHSANAFGVFVALCEKIGSLYPQVNQRCRCARACQSAGGASARGFLQNPSGAKIPGDARLFRAVAGQQNASQRDWNLA